MSGARSALIVATYRYDDPRLSMLRAPERDADALAEVLGDAAIGGFDVRTVVNQPAHVITVEVAEFFAHRHSGDVLLLHFSCHGVKDDSGELFLAASDTRMDLLEATAVSSGYVNRAMTKSRSGCVVLLLDCCYAGAFARGMTRAGTDVDVTDRFGGRGRAVITASTALQFAFEGSELTSGDLVEPGPSVFTRALVEGLRTGEADRNSDGIVSLDELYAHVHDEVTRANPDQTPQKWLFDVAGDLHVARRATPVTRPSELPGPLVESIDSLLAWERESTISPLQTLLLGSHPGRALAARIALERLASPGEDSARVRQAARAALDLHEDTAPEPGPASPETPVPVPATPAQVVEAPGGVPPGAPPAPPPARSWWRSGRSRIALAALAIVVLVGGGLGIRHWTSGSSSNQVGVTFRPPPLAGTQTILLTDSATPAAYDVLTGKESWGKGDGQSPAISQRRNQVAYLTQEGANAFGHPVVGTAAGTGMSPLLTGRSRIDCPLSARPAWAPGDTRFALLCYQGDGSYAGLWLVTSGGGAQQLRGSADSCRCGVTWAGAGHLIYGVRKGGSGTTLEVLDVATRSSAPLVTTGAPTSLWNTDPDWTSFGPGGKVVFLNSPGNGKPGQVCVVTVDAHVRQVGSTVPCEAQDALYPTWSPTGGSIAYLRGTESNQHLWIKNDPGGLGKDTGVAGLLGPPAWGSR